MKKLTVFASVLVLFGTVLATRSSAVQSGGHPPHPWSKTCDMGAVGGDGCTVTVTMTANDVDTCPDNAAQYCVSVSSSCPASGYTPAEDCNGDANCGECGYSSTPASVTCGGSCFSAAPSSGSNWDDVASDCANLSARAGGHPCN